jgi:hypothetical protein
LFLAFRYNKIWETRKLPVCGWIFGKVWFKIIVVSMISLDKAFIDALSLVWQMPWKMM